MKSQKTANDKVILRTIVADDDALARRVVRDALQDAEIIVIAEAADGREAIELCAYYGPDVVIMDLVMPGTSGLEATRTLAAEHPEIKVIILSSADDDEIGVLSARSGAVGYICKTVPPSAFPRIVEAAARGEAIMSRRLTMRLIEDVRQHRHDAAGLRPVRSPLSGREWEVLDFLCEGWATDQIADHMVVSVETVRTHLKSIFRKLGVNSREEAVAATRAMRSSLISQPPR